MNTIFRLIVPNGLLLLAVGIAGVKPALADEKETIAAIAKAFEEGSKAIRSGSSEGVIRDKRESHPEVIYKFRCDFQGDNRFLEMDYPPAAAKLWKQPGLSRIRLVWDGTACVVTQFSTDIMPKHCETRVFESFDEGLGSTPGSLGPVGDTAAWYPEQMVGKINSDRFALEKFGKDRWLLRRKPDPDAKAEEMELEADPALGFNLARYVRTTHLEAGDQVITRNVAWTKRGDLWFVKRLAVEVKIPTMDELYQKFSVEYTQFSPNIEFPAGHFSLGRLGIVEGSVVVDDRSGRSESIRFRSDADFEKSPSLDQAVERLKKG